MNSGIAPLDVDVVIPVRDGAKYLPACLDSALGQTHPPRAIIVTDDGSTDATPRILADYASRCPELAVIRSEPRGVSHARNLALQAARAPFVAFLDSDDVWERTKLERQLAVFAAAGPRVGFVHCAYYLIDEDGRRIDDDSILPPRYRGEVFSRLLVEGNIVSGSGSAVLVRRDLLDLAGGFDERLFFGEDWDLWIRLAAISELDLVPEPLVAVRVHDKSAQRRNRSRRREQFLLQNLLILDRWYATDKFPSTLRAQYRSEAVQTAITREKSRTFSVGIDDWQFFSTLSRCDSRFGRELFSGPWDFARAMCRARVLAWIGWLLRGILPPQQYAALRDFVRKRRRFGGR